MDRESGQLIDANTGLLTTKAWEIMKKFNSPLETDFQIEPTSSPQTITANPEVGPLRSHLTISCFVIFFIASVHLGIIIRPFVFTLLSWFDAPDPDFEQNIKQDLPVPPGAFPSLTDRESILAMRLRVTKKERDIAREQAAEAEGKIESCKEEVRIAWNTVTDSLEEREKEFDEKKADIEREMTELKDKMTEMEELMAGMRKDPTLVNREAIHDNVRILQNLNEHQKENARLYDENMVIKKTSKSLERTNAELKDIIFVLNQKLDKASPARIRHELRMEMRNEVYRDEIQAVERERKAIERERDEYKEVLRFWHRLDMQRQEGCITWSMEKAYNDRGYIRPIHTYLNQSIMPPRWPRGLWT
ncbi:MAG: hypothetical protein Q9227_002307 [Pyrenula ochraceoflavens]